MKTLPDALALARCIQAGLTNEDLPCPIPFSYVTSARWFADFLLEVDGEISKLQRDGKQLNDQLAIVQARCTELLVELRAYRASGICLPGWNCYCGAFNGSAKQVLTHCRCCGNPKPT